MGSIGNGGKPEPVFSGCLLLFQRCDIFAHSSYHPSTLRRQSNCPEVQETAREKIPTNTDAFRSETIRQIFFAVDAGTDTDIGPADRAKEADEERSDRAVERAVRGERGA